MIDTPHTARDAATLAQSFDEYQRRFRDLTRRIAAHFASRDWHAVQRDSVARLDLYKQCIDETVARWHAEHPDGSHDHALWAALRCEYARLTADRPDIEIAQTFFNSITRRLLTTIGVDSAIEFVGESAHTEPPREHPATFRSYADGGATTLTIAALLADLDLGVACERIARSAELIAERIDRRLIELWDERRFDAIEMLRPVFYRNKGAYAVGRIRRGAVMIPLLLALLNDEDGLRVDAALLHESEVSIVFSFTRSYFHADTAHPSAVVAFLHAILPHKRIAELYTALGYNKHGKTELYRDLMQHMAHTTDRFVIAPGERGMVMIVFTMPSYDIVFKVIKDRFAYPKTNTRQTVLDRYELVFRHDRGGRLIDAQEFEHLKFDRDCFDPALLRELLEVAPSTVSLEGDAVVIRHVYTERRTTPLNLYIRQADHDAIRAAVIDFGQAIRDLTATNIFPGDLLLKNFGVTRQGRVVFYDYDELCLVTDCTFRELPDDLDDYGGEPWFYVGESDVFPAEFERFLGLPEPLRSVFVHRYRDLFGVRYWRDLQARHRAGEIIDIFPYGDRQRLPD